MWDVKFSNPVTSSFTIEDISEIGSLSNSAQVYQLKGSESDFSVRVLVRMENAVGTLGCRLMGGQSIYDIYGQSLTLTADSPLITIDEYNTGPLRWDADDDGDVDAADVTTLGNYVVNGIPLP